MDPPAVDHTLPGLLHSLHCHSLAFPSQESACPLNLVLESFSFSGAGGTDTFLEKAVLEAAVMGLITLCQAPLGGCSRPHCFDT